MNRPESLSALAEELESGVVVRVPLFVNVGDRIRVDTRSGEYVSRA